MTLEKFHELFWSKNYIWLNDHMYYHSKKSEKGYHWDKEKNGEFDPHYSMNNFSREIIKFTPKEIENKYNSVDLEKYANKKFILGEYTFYCYSSGDIIKEEYDDEKSYCCEQSFYLDYHGFRIKILKLNQKIYYKNDIITSYNKNFEGADIMFELLNNNPDIELIPYDLLELTGPIGFKVTGQYGLTPPPYLQKKHPTHNWEGAGQKIGQIDMDHFVLMETKEGIYQPSENILNYLFHYDNRQILKGKTKKLKDLGITKIQFRNNANYDITVFYNLDDVEVKASKSVLKQYPNLRKFSKDEKAIDKIKAEEKAAEEAYNKEIYDDTYTLMQHGKIIRENIRSNDIINYFANKEYKDFEFSVINAGKKCFEIAPELNKIFFMKFGIYGRYELSGEKFVDYEDIESINKLKNITVPKRILTLYNHGEIYTHTFEKESKLFQFDKGATYIGATKNKNGEVIMILEDGDDGL
jgi:hypothetical protein